MFANRQKPHARSWRAATRKRGGGTDFVCLTGGEQLGYVVSGFRYVLASDVSYAGGNGINVLINRVTVHAFRETIQNVGTRGRDGTM